MLATSINAQAIKKLAARSSQLEAEKNEKNPRTWQCTG